jgi:hypothetical protein
MTTRSTVTTAGGTINGRGESRFTSLRVRAVLGVVTLGCAAALALAGLRGGEGTQGQAQRGAAAPSVANPQVIGVERQQFLALNRHLPDGTLPSVVDTIDFGPAECGVVPCVTTYPVTTVPDQFTFREDRRADAIPALVASDYVPDFWTYREDRRAGAAQTTPIPGSCIYASDAVVAGEGCAP